MKKFPLSFFAMTVLTTPALAGEGSGLTLELGGQFNGYVSYVSQDDPVDDVREIDILRKTEVRFLGETTLDNGLTVGVEFAADTDAGDGFELGESYAFFSGSWGRVNFGQFDGAAFLLQVAAPSADENVDGIRQEINPFRYAGATANTSLLAINEEGALATPATAGMDYDNDRAKDEDKITYLSPLFNGFQAGVSYTPDADDGSDGVTGNNTEVDEDPGSVWEIAARYEGTFNTVGVVLGAGYTHADIEGTAAATQDEFQEWNVGADLDIGAFGIGAIYTQNNNTSDDNDRNRTWVVGADYTTGPFKLGLSYLDNDNDSSGTDVDSDRWTGGAVYTYGPGMSLRGSVQHVSHDIEGADDIDGTAILLGTQVDF